MKNYVQIICFLSFASIVAQEDTKVQDNMLKANILSPGITFEKAVSTNNTINLDANLSIGYSLNSNTSKFVVVPYLRSQFRHYYNLEKRNLKGKRIDGNSGNYIAPTASYYFEPTNNSDLISVSDGLTLGVAWGLQRTYKSGLNINLNTGLGYNFSENQSRTVIPIINFTLGWVLWKK